MIADRPLPLSDAALAERFATLVWALLDGDSAPLRRIIEASVATWTEDGDGIRVLRPTFACGISTSDPVSAAISVCFALAGQQWIAVPWLRAGAELVSQRWSAERKAAKAVLT